jgi:hypothetical protein
VVVGLAVAFKLPLFSALIPLATGAFLFSLFNFFTPKSSFTGSSNFDGSCAVLIVDEAEDDGVIQDKLFSGGLNDFISESSQLVSIDDFGALKFIPLDSFHSKIESFDPRDDGYAAKLRSFFVHDGKRFFFRITENSSGRPADTVKQIDAILKDIPFTFLVLARRTPVYLYYLLLAAGCVLTLFFSSNRRLFAFQLPALLATGQAGFFSIILAAILTGIWELLREPLSELFASRRYNRRPRDYAGSGFRGIRERLNPFRLNLFFALLFFVFLLAFSFMGLLNPLLLLAVCASFTFLYFLSFKTEEERSHIQFTPVLLLPYRVKTFSLSPLLLPFGLLAISALFLPSGYAGPSPVDSGLLLSTDDYNRHIAFQKSFSYIPLNQELNTFSRNALIQNDYLRYYLGEDGLITGNDAYAVSEDSEAPRFPLEKLMDFLVKYNKLAVGESAGIEKLPGRPAATTLKEWISVAFIFAFCLFDILMPRIVPMIAFKFAFKKKIPAIGDKRIAA